MIELRSISKEFQQPDGSITPVLHSLDLTLESGQFTMIIGSNGSGKSTLLNAIAGRYVPDRGQILLDGIDVTRSPEYRRAGYIGRVFQNPLHGTCPTMTLAENMRLAEMRGRRRGLRLGLGRAQVERYRESLQVCEMGLEDRIGQLAGTLSGGQRQALTLILATLSKPKLLLLDEPTAALDPRAAEQIATLIAKVIRDQNLTALMVTHSMHQALSMGDRTIALHQGRITDDWTGPTRQALRAEDLVNRLADLYRIGSTLV